MCLAEALLRIPDTRDARRADPRQDRRRRLAARISATQPVAVRQCRDLGAGDHRQAGRDQQRDRAVGGADAADRARRRAADPHGRRHGDAHDGRAVRHRPDDRGSAGEQPQDGGARLPLFLRHAGRGGDDGGRMPRAISPPTSRRSTRSAAPSAGRGIYEGPGISIKLSALHPRYSRAQRDRVMAELLPRLAGARDAGAALRHRPQHRCRGSRPAGAVARSAGGAVLRPGAGRLERHRLRRAGLPEARAVRDRLR